MNNPTWVDRLTGQIPGKTEGVSILTGLTNFIFLILCAFGVCLPMETVTAVNGLLVAMLGAALGARVSRVETTANQVQAAQTVAADTAVANLENKA